MASASLYRMKRLSKLGLTGSHYLWTSACSPGNLLRSNLTSARFPHRDLPRTNAQYTTPKMTQARNKRDAVEFA